MAYIEKIVSEAEFHMELVNTMVANGWKKVSSFYKTIYKATKSEGT